MRTARYNSTMKKQQTLNVKNVCVHNLKNVNLTLPAGELIVFTGVSGSGKSSMAFDTIYMEGQRRYVESLSTFARRQMQEMSKPDLESADGISPTISIEQKTAGKNPRSTVGTLTEIYDFLRVLFARIAIPHCPISGEAVRPSSRERIIKTIQHLREGTKLLVLAPFAKQKKGEFKEEFQELVRKGFMRVRIDGAIHNLSEEIRLDGSVAHNIDLVIDRIQVSPQNHSRIAEAVSSALQEGNGILSIVNLETEEETLFSMFAYSPASGLSYRSLEPQDFSFNSPSGMCSRCNGLGKVIEFDLDKVIDSKKSIQEDACSIARSCKTVRYGNIYRNLAELYDFDLSTPWKDLPENAKKVFLYGTEKKWTRMRFIHPVRGIVWFDLVRWQGVLHEARQRYQLAKSASLKKKMETLLKEQVCPECDGARIKSYPAAATLGKKSIAQISALTVSEALVFFQQLQITEQEMLIAEELLKEIIQRLTFLQEVGLHYLALERSAPTLSGGEAQRVRLASQIGCGLVGITYILDEPSIGLHPIDNTRLIKTLEHLKNIGNTVIVVEHDEETIWAADRIVDFGPGAGSRGGKILVNGSASELLECKESFTGAYLSGRLEIPIPKKRRKRGTEKISLKGASHHNLKNVTLDLPLGLFVAATGVSGSGKSSLVTDTLWPALANKLHRADHTTGPYKSLTGADRIDKVIAIDQSPIGRNPRSNPSTYIKLFDEIRELFSELPDAKIRGFKPGRFSFNVKEGSCLECHGMGMVKIDMDFLDDAWIDCHACGGLRFDEATLSILYKGKSIYDVLQMEVEEALAFFTNIPSIRKKLETLTAVGLNYLKLGQSSTTLSGGEAQRVKLAKELVRPATGKTLYILDEPTTGLHFHDIKHLLEVLHRLVDHGNTVLVIEHNMDIVKTADWVIDLGPEGGKGGGEIIAQQTPEAIAKMKSPTGKALYEALYTSHQQRRRHHEKIVEKKIESITVEGAEENNLKLLNISIPREKITICTGPSGSGKSSLAFDTVYAEGMRRYIESLSPYARQFVKQSSKPKVHRVEGLSPAIAIEQKQHAGNPRSTVGTQTEIYDYLRVLWARLGTAHCPETGEPIRSITKEVAADRILSWNEGEKFQVLAPVQTKRGEPFEEILARFSRLGFVRIRLNGVYFAVDQEVAFDPKQKNELYIVIDRLLVKESMRKRLVEAIEHAASWGKEQFVVDREGKDILFNLSFAVESTGKSYPPITPHTFAFNVAEGMCHDCQGLGTQYGANLLEKRELLDLSSSGLLRLLWEDVEEALQLAETLLQKEGIDTQIPIRELSGKKHQILLGGGKKFHPFGKLSLRWIGINTMLAKIGKNSLSEIKEGVLPLLEETICPGCKGTRINPLARSVTLNGLSIADFCSLPIEKALPFFRSIPIAENESKLLSEVTTQIGLRLKFLQEIGVHYLSLDRRAPTLSGGEAQRIRLARQLGSGLTGVLYVLDEPTIGLHPADNARLNDALLKLKNLGNTLVLVEHDPQTIALADKILDFGPGAGEKGGHIVAEGTYKQILRNKSSLTGKYLSGKEKIPIPTEHRAIDGEKLLIKNGSLHNLKNLDLEIPLGAFTCVTGVSGSGKSTLVQDLLLPALKKGIERQDRISLNGNGEILGISQVDKVLSIDQNPIGHTVRSDVSTYTDLLGPIRILFSKLPQAQVKGLQPKNFSTNHRKGMCTHCWGLGYKRVQLLFLPTVRVPCQECGGLRLNPLSLEVYYHGKNLGEWLQVTVDEALGVFSPHPKVRRILETLISVGLGYLRLGQEMASLSGGEAQRIKLSRELSKRSTGKTVYLLDEPTTGLHPDDIVKLLKVLHGLVDKGNSVVVIEHHLEVIQNGDYVIELGPEGGERGGKLLYAGRPEGMRTCKKSITGKFMKN